MSGVRTVLARRAGTFAAASAVLCYLAASSAAQQSRASEAGEIGRINFEQADLPPANVEVDLSQGMFNDLFGIGDAAIAGVAETLLESAERTEGAEGTRMAAEQLAAARQIMQLASDVIREVRVRAYEEAPEGVASRFDEQLEEQEWETIVRARKENENVQVALLRSGGAIRGVFVIAAGNDGLVLANVVGDISPENAKKLSSAAAKIGLENGLQQVLEQKMRDMKHRLPPPGPPSPPDGNR